LASTQNSLSPESACETGGTSRSRRSAPTADYGLDHSETARSNHVRALGLLTRMATGSNKQLPDRMAGPVDLAPTEREDDHGAAGQREVAVVGGCLGNVGRPRSYVVPLAAQRRWPAGNRVGRHVRNRREAVEAWLEPTSAGRARDEISAGRLPSR
jgi:hypothetical protein